MNDRRLETDAEERKMVGMKTTELLLFFSFLFSSYMQDVAGSAPENESSQRFMTCNNEGNVCFVPPSVDVFHCLLLL